MDRKNYSNSIIVGGPIAVGKSTLVAGLAKLKGGNKIDEFESNDDLNDIVLQKLYQGERTHPAMTQAYFLLKRYDNYKKHANSLITSIFDRGIWEDGLFSKHLMKKQVPTDYEHYKKLGKKIIEELMVTEKQPLVYIFLTVNWDYFKQRIFSRGRESEILNFSQNEKYFRALLNDYNSSFKPLLEKWGQTIIHIDTNNLKKEKVLEIVVKKLKELGIE